MTYYRVFFTRGPFARGPKAMLASPYFKSTAEALIWINSRAKRQGRLPKEYCVDKVGSGPKWYKSQWIPDDDNWILNDAGVATFNNTLTNELGEVAP